ncbi:response regulator [Dehalobacter sp. DCM]|uniref:response regulator n=1 Tax=Dehalobacter sp. DCM TaxID=2907827 RepID=UPI0030816FC7|nr:response regulator [Dehalobacter sp. DCM]
MNRILVVEDNPLIGMVIQTALTDDGHNVEVRKNALEGLYLMKSGYVPDLLLTDLIMQGMGGRDLIQRMRNDNQLRHIPAVIITAAIPNRDNLPEANQYQGFLSKPFNIDDLLRTVNCII